MTQRPMLVRLLAAVALIPVIALCSVCLPGYSTPAAAGEEIRLYSRESTAGIDSPWLPGKLEPAFGAYLGAPVDRDRLNGDVANAPAVYGRPYSAVLIYVPWGQGLSYWANNAVNAGVALQVSWEPSQGLDAVQDNQYARDFARSLAALDIPVFLRFGGEMNGDWTIWGGQPDLYREKFQLIAGIMHSQAPNVAMVWSPGCVPEEDLDSYYPGDEYVDWVGINGYSDYYFIGKPEYENESWTWEKFYQGYRANPMRKFEYIYGQYSGRKPIMISETGVSWLNNSNGQHLEEWAAKTMKEMYGYLPLLYPRVKGIYYFNAGVSQDFCTYNVAASPAMTRAYSEAISSPYYLYSIDQPAPFYYQPLASSRVTSELCDLAVYVDDGKQFVTAVEYYVNGTLAGRSTLAPWDATCRLPADGSPALVEVRAINDDGSLACTSSWTLAAPSSPAITVLLNGEPLAFDSAPAVLGSRIMLPVRTIGQALGYRVLWDDRQQAALLDSGSRQVEIRLRQQQILVDGQVMAGVDLAGRTVDNRVLAPLRYVAEGFGLDVEWDGGSHTVSLEG